MSHRSLRFLALAAVTALLAASCGGGGDDDGGGGGGGGASGDCPLDSLDGASGPVEVTYWHSMTRVLEETLVRLTDQFNASQDQVKVTLVNQTSYDDTFEKYSAALSGGDLPDLVQLDEIRLQQMIDSQSIVAAQDCIDAEPAAVLDDVIPRVRDYFTVEGSLYPVPFNTSNPILYYDKSAFEAAGLDPEDPPSSLEEVASASQAIVDARVAPYGYALRIDGWFLEQMLAKSGELYVNEGNGRDDRATEVVYDNEAGLEIFEWISEMISSGLAFSTGAQSGNIDHYLALGNGQAAMTIETSAALGTITQLLGSGQFANVSLGAAPMPGPEGDGGVMVGGAANYVVKNSSPEEQAGALTYALYLLGVEQQAEWAAGTGYVPVNEQSLDQPVLEARWAEIPEFRIAYDQLTTGPNNAATSGPVLGAYKDVRRVMNDSIQEIVEGAPPQTALDSAKEAADAAIADYNERIGV